MLITVIDSDKPTVTPIARRFHEMGFESRHGGHGRVSARARAFRRSACSRSTRGVRTAST